MYIAQRAKKYISAIMATTILSTAVIVTTPKKAEALGWTPASWAAVAVIGAGAIIHVAELYFNSRQKDLNGNTVISGGGGVGMTMIVTALPVLLAAGDEDDEKKEYQASVNTNLDYKKNKKSKSDKDEAIRVQLHNNLRINDDWRVGGLISYTKQDIFTGNNKTYHQRLGLGLSLQGHLSEKISFSSLFRISNGDTRTHWSIKELISNNDQFIDADYIFKGKQKLNKVHFDNQIGYDIDVQGHTTVTPSISLKFTRQFSSAYYAYNRFEDIMTLNQKPSNDLAGDFMINTQTKLIATDSLNMFGGIILGVSRELYKQGKASPAALIADNGPSIKVTLPFDKKKNTVWESGVHFSLKSLSSTYELKTHYIYGQDKDNNYHQGQVQFKINF